MNQLKSLSEAEITAFTDQALFAKPPTPRGRMPLIAKWIMAGTIMSAVLTIGIFTILTRPDDNPLGYDPIKAFIYR